MKSSFLLSHALLFCVAASRLVTAFQISTNHMRLSPSGSRLHWDIDSCLPWTSFRLHQTSRTQQSFVTKVVACQGSADPTGSMRGRVCVVTGGSRGIGRGIAVELGKAGATVYVTGTSTMGGSATTNRYSTNRDVGGPGTIEETAEMVTAAGGTGIAVPCNHADDVDVARLFERVSDEQGRLDVLVNNAFRVPAGGNDAVVGNFWELDVGVWDAMHTVGLRSHYVASCQAVPLMLRSCEDDDSGPRPLIAMVSSFGGATYTFNVAYGVGKAGVDRLAKDMAQELRPYNICTCSLYPGVVMTERMLALVEAGEAEALGIPLGDAESPAYTGRAVVALATDPLNHRRSGSVQVVAELASEYQFYDAELPSAPAPASTQASEGPRRPPSIRSLRFLIPNYAMSEALRARVPRWLIPDWRLPMWVMALGKPE